MDQSMPKEVLNEIVGMQRNEITEYYVYMNIAKRIKNVANRQILETIARQEKAHHDIWEKHTGVKVRPNQRRILFFGILNFFFGFTFALKIMESGENHAKRHYAEIVDYFPEAAHIAEEEDAHENELIGMLDEDRLNYVGSMVLGLNDALVELTGALAGLTLAFVQYPELIGISGLITGIAASLSMASSEYLSSKADGKSDALKSAVYTGITYIFTVLILVLPYLLIANPYIALAIMVGSVVVIIFLFNFYISVAKSLPFKKRFFEMLAISLGVATISFGIGYLVNLFFGISA